MESVTEQSNFQSTCSRTGQEFENSVLNNLVENGYTILDKNKRLDGIGVNVDYIAERDGIIEYGEAKGGNPGGKKRPGAQRTDSVKKAICNGALIKSQNPESRYVIYFSAKPVEGNSSDEMIKTALSAGFVDEVRYLIEQ